MREILFSGKRIDNGEWIYGFYFYDSFYNKAYITIGNYCMTASTIISNQRIMNALEVDPNTVRQYTGRLDKNGTKIFEGDIVRNKNKYFQFVGIVKYQNGQFVVDWKLHQRVSNGVISSTFTHHLENADEVIGNIYDNPELMKGE